MEDLNLSLIEKHELNVQLFFNRHKAALENINTVHKYDGSYIAFFSYNYRNKTYNEDYVDMNQFMRKDKTIDRETLYIFSKKSSITGVREKNYLEDVIALVFRGAIVIHNLHDDSIEQKVLFSCETRISGKAEIYDWIPRQITLVDGKQGIGEDITFNEELTIKMRGDEQVHFLSHIMRSHRQLN